MLFVIHICASLDHGGLERMVVRLTNERNRRHPGSTVICCLDCEGELAGQVDSSAVSCIKADRSRFPWDFEAVRRFRQKLSVSSPVVLHAHNMAAWQYAVLAARGTGAGVVYTQHGANVHNQGFRNRIRSMLLSRFTEKIVAVSENTAVAMTEYQGIPRGNIDVVRNGVDVGIFEEEKTPGIARTGIRAALGIPSDSFVVGSVGRLDYVKGFDVLLSAFARSHTQIPPHFLLLVGDGPERGNLEKQAKKLGVDKNVIFAGYRENAGEYLKVMDLFVAPSRSEGISVALLEACASGLPVVVTDAGGNPEVIESGEYGMVVPSGDVAAMTAAIEQLCSDEVLRTRLGRAARERVCGCFSIEKTLVAYERIYSDATARRPVAPVGG